MTMPMRRGPGWGRRPEPNPARTPGRGAYPSPTGTGSGTGFAPARRGGGAIARTSDGGLRAGLAVGAGFTVFIWAAYLIDSFLLGGLLTDTVGLRPLDTQGLLGILFAHFLHGGVPHLMANTVPAALFAGLIAFTSKKLWWQVTLIVMVVAGLGTWLLGGVGTVHVGASGLVYGWLAFLIVRGFYNKSPGQIFIGMLLGFFYSSLIWGVFPGDIGISWQMHLFGAIGGIIAASTLKRGRTPALERGRTGRLPR